MDKKDNLKSQKVKYFFVGVGKCGTSWLYEFLKRHEITSVPSLKEPYLIDQPASKQQDIIDKLYSNPVKMCDFSNLYYWDIDNPQKIYDYNNASKIIITVRQPSLRIISHFGFSKQNGLIREETIGEYLLNGDFLHIVARSDYAKMIERYVSKFGRDNVLILPLEQLKNTPQIYVDRLLAFLEEPQFALSDDDIKPTLKSARARSLIVAKSGKQLAVILRSFGMLSLLGRLKSSKIIRSILFKTVESSNEDVSFANRTKEINELDQAYSKLLSQIL